MGQMARLTGCGETAQAQKLLMNLTFEGPAMILILVSFGKLLESKAKRRTGEAIEKLMNLTPPRASVLRDNKEIEIDEDAFSNCPSVVLSAAAGGCVEKYAKDNHLRFVPVE